MDLLAYAIAAVAGAWIVTVVAAWNVSRVWLNLKRRRIEADENTLTKLKGMSDTIDVLLAWKRKTEEREGANKITGARA